MRSISIVITWTMLGAALASQAAEPRAGCGEVRQDLVRITACLSPGGNSTCNQQLAGNPYRAQIAAVPDQKLPSSTTEARLKSIDGGNVWCYIVRQYLPLIRSGVTGVVYTSRTIIPEPEPVPIACNTRMDISKGVIGPASLRSVAS